MLWRPCRVLSPQVPHLRHGVVRQPARGAVLPAGLSPAGVSTPARVEEWPLRWWLSPCGPTLARVVAGGADGSRGHETAGRDTAGPAPLCIYERINLWARLFPSRIGERASDQRTRAPQSSDISPTR